MLNKLLLLCFLFISSAAQAVTVTAKIVADDYFSVFVGDSTATSLSLVGGSNGNLWWNQGGSFTFDLTAGQYIYVAAWDSPSYGSPHMWVGEFDIGGTTLLSTEASDTPLNLIVADADDALKAITIEIAATTTEDLTWDTGVWEVEAEYSVTGKVESIIAPSPVTVGDEVVTP